MKKIVSKLATFGLALGLSLAARADVPASDSANINRLTLSLSQAMIAAQKDAGDNLICSPYNILTAMAMVGSGADGGTQEEFNKVFFGGGNKDFPAKARALMQFNSQLLKNAAGKVDLLSANSIWVNRNVATLNPGFASAAEKDFAAKITDEDFSDPAVPGKINGWASENTKGLITKVIDQLDNRDAIVLSSALYFKGSWTEKFDKALTVDGTFTADSGNALTLPMMHQRFGAHGGLSYQEGADFEAIALGYGAKDSSPMRLILIRPKDAATSARDWLAAQKATAGAAWLDTGHFESVAGDVALPHISIRQNHDLIPALQPLGLKAAFTQNADFSPMADTKGNGLYISRVTHDVVFKTDEEGSEAAAVTTVTMARAAAIMMPKTIRIAFDRSFVFALQDTATNAVLFIGAVNRPEAGK